MHAVTITASYFSSGPSRTVSRTFTSAAVTGRLAAMLNGAHAAVLDGKMLCPAQWDTYKLAFARSPASAPYLVATEGPCSALSVTVLGHKQPTLQEPAALNATLSKLVGK
jgi:hypothetical protein